MKAIDNNTYKELMLYFSGIEKFSNLESRLVRSSDYLNSKTAHLFAYGDTDKLRILYQLTLYGFMQFSIYDLYKISYNRMRDLLPLGKMENKFDSYRREDVLKMGFCNQDLEAIRDFNSSMSALVENLFSYENQFDSLFKKIDQIEDLHDSDAAAELAAFMEYEFPHASGAIYLNTVSKIDPSTPIILSEYAEEHGMVPLSYKKHLLNTKKMSN